MRLTSILRMTTPPKVNPIALTGFGAGNDFYDRTRPTYPRAALEAVRDAVKGQNILEIGSGTGIFSRLVLDPPEGYPKIPIRTFTAVEPSEGMRASFDRKLPTSISAQVQCVPGTFSQLPEFIAPGSIDAILIAQAFHWADPDYDSAVQAMAKALKPESGVACFVWNMEDEDAAPWVKQFRKKYQQFESGSPQYRLKLWHKTFSLPSYTALFSPPEHSFYASTLPCTASLAIDRALSKSYTSVLPEDEKTKLKEELAEILDRGDGMEFTGEEENGEKVFHYPYQTEVVVMRRKW